MSNRKLKSSLESVRPSIVSSSCTNSASFLYGCMIELSNMRWRCESSCSREIGGA